MKKQTIKLSEIKKGTLLYGIASVMIKEQGFYTCKYEGIKTKIIA